MKALQLIDKISYWADRLSRLLLASTMTLMIGDVLFGVFNRFIFKFSISGMEEIARFLLIWTCMIGAAVALRSGGHIAVVFIVERLGKYKLIIALFNNMIIFLFLSILAYYGILTCIGKARLLSPAIRLSMLWPFLAIPTGSIIMMIHTAYLTKNLVTIEESP